MKFFLAHEFHEFSCKRVQSSLLELPSAAENVKKFTRNMLNYINGDLIGRTNFHYSKY